MKQAFFDWGWRAGCWVLGFCLWVGVAAWAAEPHTPSAGHVPSTLPPDTQWKLVWSDEFDGAKLDRTKWDFRLHIMQTRFETWTEEGAALDGKGHLLMKIYEKNGQYYSSQIQTGSNYLDRPGNRYSKSLTWPIAKLEPPKFAHKYGYYEIRCKLTTQEGNWSAFWLQSPNIGSTLDPRISGVEIDIMENFERDGRINHAVIWGGYGANGKNISSGHRPHPGLTEGFHTYGVDWHPDEYIFYIDGKESWRCKGPVSDREEFILVSTECKGYRKGGPAPELKAAKLPDYFVVDYVRVYDPVGGYAPVKP